MIYLIRFHGNVYKAKLVGVYHNLLTNKPLYKFRHGPWLLNVTAEDILNGSF